MLQMEPLRKMKKLKMMHTRRVQKYMKQKLSENSRLEFQWPTNMVNTRFNLKGKYPITPNYK